MFPINLEYPWVSPRLIEEILVGCGSINASSENYRLLASLLAHVIVNPNVTSLTERERACLFWFAHGKSYQEISVLMNIKSGSIRTYVKRIKHKLNCHTTIEAVFMTMRFRYFGLNEQSIIEMYKKIKEE